MSSSPEGDEGDIYGDLPHFQFDEAFKQLEEEKIELQSKVEELGAQLDVMKIENQKLAAKVKSLGKNISCLYKTAQRELERKEQIIADLRKERDDLLFRRGLKEDKLANKKRPSRKQLTPTKKVSNGNLKRIQEAKVKNGGSPVITLISLDSEDQESRDSDKNERKVDKIPEKSEEPSNVKVDHNLPQEDTPNSDLSTDKKVQEEIVSPVVKHDCSTTPEKDTEKEKTFSTESALKTPMITPIKEEKFTVHMSSEDCGFGQRRRIRRVLKSSSTLTVAAQVSPAPKAETITSATPNAGITASAIPKAENITSAEEKGVKRPLECWKKLDVIEMDPIVHKRSRLDYNVSPKLHDDKVLETSIISNAVDLNEENSVSDVCKKNIGDNSLGSENIALPVNSSSNVADLKEGNKNISISVSDQGIDMGKDPRKEDNNLSKISDDQRAKDLLKKYGTSFGVSAYPIDNQDSGVKISGSDDVQNPSCQDQIESTPSKHCDIDFDSKTRTLNTDEGCNSSKLSNYLSDRLEDSRSKDNFSNASPSSSSPAHSYQSEHRHASPTIPQNEKPSVDGNFKRRSWERERVSYCDLNDFSDTDRKGRQSERNGKSGDVGRDGYKRDIHRGKFSNSRDRNRDSGRFQNLDRGRDMDSGDLDRGRENNRNRDVDRRRDYNRDREMVRGRNIDRGKDSSRLRDSDRDRDCERNRDFDRVKETNRVRERDYDRGQDADRSWNADHGRDIDRGRNRSRDRDRSKERDRSRDRDRSRERSRDRDRSRDRARSRERDRGRDQNRYRDQHRIRANEKRDTSDSSRKYSNESRDSDIIDRKTKGISGGNRSGRSGNWNGYRDRDKPQNEAEERDTTEKWCEKRNLNQDKLKTRTQELSSSSGTTPADDISPSNPIEPPEWD